MKKKPFMWYFSGYRIKNIVRMIKLTCLLMMMTLVSTGFNTKAQTGKIDLKAENQTILEIFREIERKTDYGFFVKSDQIDLNKRYSIDISGKSVEEVLFSLFGEDYTWQVINNNITVMRKDAKANPGNQQPEFSVSGRVTDRAGLPLPGVTVVVKGTTGGTMTNNDGYFNLSRVQQNDILVFSFVGMKPQEIGISGRNTINVALEEESYGIEEVVAIGYGVQRKSDLTGAIAQVKGEELKKLTVNNIQNALQGQAAGVYVSQNNGAPGAGADVIIRGQTSITGLNATLYVLDGIPLTGALNSINPQDIESIEVLKDASAAAIYGSRASSGVILITTKRGKSTSPKVSFDASYGWQSLSKKIPMLNAQQWSELQAEAVENNKIRFPNSPGLHVHNPLTWDDQAKAVRQGIVDSTDWQDAYYSVAPIKNYNVSISGGTDKSQVYVSAGLQDQEGIAPNSYFKRYTVRLNSDHKVLSDRLKVGNNLAMSYFTSRGVTQNEDFSGGVGSVLRMSPMVAVYKKPGTYEGETNRFAGTSDTRFYGPAETGNPIREALLNNNVNGTYNITGSFFADLEIVKGLIFHTDWGGEIQFNEGKNFIYAYREYLGGNNTNRLNRSAGKQYMLQTRNYLNFNRTFGNSHTLNLMAGTDFQDFYDNDFSTYRLNFAVQENPDLWYLGLGDALTASNSESASSWAILSYYGRLNYNFKDRYLITSTLRRDGSSRFDKNSRWGNFPSFSFAWKISNEGFFPENKVLTDVKLRAGWGLLGNERSAGNYVTSATVGRGVIGGIDNGYNFGTEQSYVTGARPLRIPNRDLTWESSEQTNVGIDLGFWERKLTLVADYFVKNTKDMILSMPLPVAGRGTLDAPRVNIGTLQNKGFEFELTYNNRGREFSYDIGLNLSTGRGNKVTNLAPGVEFLDGGTYRLGQSGILSRTEVGQSIGRFYLYEVVGIFRNQEDLAKYPKQSGAAIGDYIFRNADTTSVNGNQVINTRDRVYYGNPWPIFIGGLRANFYYKNFDLNLFFQGSYGNDILNTTSFFLIYNGSTENFNYSTKALDRFHPEKNPNGKYPMLFSQDPANNRHINSHMVEDGSYLRLQNLQIGYALPDKVLRAIYFSNLRIFASMANVFTITNYTGYNPDLGTRNNALQKGIDRGLYPVARTISLGLNLGF